MTELSKEAIERVRKQSDTILRSRFLPGVEEAETILALIAAHARLERENAELRAERERLVAVAEEAVTLVDARGDVGQRVSIGAIARALDAWKATVKP